MILENESEGRGTTLVRKQLCVAEGRLSIAVESVVAQAEKLEGEVALDCLA